MLSIFNATTTFVTVNLIRSYIHIFYYIEVAHLYEEVLMNIEIYVYRRMSDFNFNNSYFNGEICTEFFSIEKEIMVVIRSS